jgi:hypothetical protein
LDPKEPGSKRGKRELDMQELRFRIALIFQGLPDG